MFFEIGQAHTPRTAHGGLFGLGLVVWYHYEQNIVSIHHVVRAFAQPGNHQQDLTLLLSGWLHALFLFTAMRQVGDPAKDVKKAGILVAGHHLFEFTDPVIRALFSTTRDNTRRDDVLETSTQNLQIQSTTRPFDMTLNDHAGE